MAYYLKLYLITLAAFLSIDMIWLGLVARSLYRNYLGFLMAPKANWLAAIIFYLLFVLGLLIFRYSPGPQGKRTWCNPSASSTVRADHVCDL